MADVVQAHDTITKQKAKEYADDVTRLRQEHDTHVKGKQTHNVLLHNKLIVLQVSPALYKVFNTL